jgi:eukaryotic-like serine/threonine-protein kinase
MFKPYQKAEISFDLIKEIGQDGKNSKTFVSMDHQLNAEIVTKQISKAEISSPANFFDESKALYASAHTNVVQVHYACYDKYFIYVAMPYYRKGSVKSLMATQRLTVREIITLGCQTLSGLHHIHSKGLIHFDVKPDNILLSERGETLVSDFGLAKQMNFSGRAAQERLYTKMLPPEAMTGADEFDRTFDIYQLGLTLYRMCVGNNAFNDQFAAYGVGTAFNRNKFRAEVCNGYFPDRKAYPAHAPTKLKNVINKCLQKLTRDRYQSAIEVANALADVDGSELDWRLIESPDKKVWTKNENGTCYEFSVNCDGGTEFYRTVGAGLR